MDNLLTSLKSDANQAGAYINAIPDLIFIVSKEGIILKYNNPFNTELYATPENFLGKSISSVLPPEVSGAALKFIRKTLRTKTLQIHNYKLSINEDIREFEARYTVKDKNKVLVIVREETELNRVKRELKESHEQIDHVYNYSSDPVFQINVEANSEFRFISVNAAWLEATALSKEMVLNKLVREVIPEPSLIKVIERYKEAIAQGKVVEWEEETVYPAGIKTGIVRITPVFGKDGMCTQLIGTVRDISDLKRTEEVLIENKKLTERNRLILQTMQDGYILADSKGDIIEVNPAYCKMTGYKRGELVSKNIMTLEGRLTPKQVEEKIQLMMEKGQLRFDTVHHKKNGKLIDLDVSISIMMIDHQPLVAAFARDISQEKIAEQESLLLNQQLRELTAHLQTVREEERLALSRELHDELGQQLTAILMDISLLQANLADAENKQVDELDELSTLVSNSISTLRRINSQLRPGILDDFGLFASIEWQLQQFSKRYGITHALSIKMAEPEMEDQIPIAIFRVLQESLTNISKHAKATNVKVILKEKPGYMLMHVKDNGVGFEKNELKRKKSFGIQGMQERALMFDGELIIKSKKEIGTELILKIPC